MARKKRVPLPDGRVIEGTVMNFQTGGEHWNEYLVDDGTVVRVKLVVTEIIRLDGEYNAQGEPIYTVESTNVSAISAPEELHQSEE
ncbi:MAG: hypothetical protein ACFB50_18800 [Rubrobacteraceae bacterium]